MKRWAIMLMLGVATVIALCAQKPIEKPTVTVDDVKITGVSATKIDTLVRVLVDNPNPVGAKLTKVSFDLYYKENSEYKYLGHGEKTDIEIRKNGVTAVEIPVVIENERLVRAIMELTRKGSVELKVSGSAYIDLKATTFEVPFEKVKVVALPPPTTPTPTTVTPTVTPTPTPTPTSTIPTPTPTPKLKLVINIEPSPAKVGETVTIKVTDENGSPVKGAWVGYIEVAKAVFTGDVITNLKFIGKTDENGIVTYKFTVPDIYYIGAKKLGYKFGYEVLRIKILS